MTRSDGSDGAGSDEPVVLAINALTMSIGSGKTTVVFFSAPISVSVCR